jgi:hypothetical protein
MFFGKPRPSTFRTIIERYEPIPTFLLLLCLLILPYISLVSLLICHLFFLLFSWLWLCYSSVYDSFKYLLQHWFSGHKFLYFLFILTDFYYEV